MARAAARPVAREAALILGAFLTVALVAMLGRIVVLQVDPSPALKRNIQQRITHRSVPSMRGDLLDRRGRLVATTRLGYRVFVDPAALPDPPDEAIVALAEALDVPVETIGERIVRFAAVNAEIMAQVPPEEPQTKATIRAELLESILRRLGLSAEDGESGQVVEWSSGQEPAGAASDDSTTRPLDHSTTASERRGGLVRYVRVSGILNDEQVERVRRAKIPGVHLERRSVREYPGGDVIASIVGKVGAEDRGLMGSEQRLDALLTGREGRVGYVRDSFGRPLWIEVGHVQPAERGRDVRLSIDLELQRMAAEELQRGVEEADAAGGRLVMLDPATGEILAMVDIVRDVPGLAEFPWQPRDAKAWSWAKEGRRFRTILNDERRHIHPALGRNRCVEDVYEPGSTFKPFVWATVTEMGLARPDEVFDTEGGKWHTAYGRYVEDVVKRPTMTWAEVLVNSSNIGMVKGAQRLTPGDFHDAVVRFGFGRRTGLGLPGEATGIVTPLKHWTKYTHTSMAFGYEVAVTPVQMARAYTAFARCGESAGTLAPIRLWAAEGGEPEQVRRVLPAATAILTRQTMAHVVENLDVRLAARKEAESGWRYTMFGKSGTAQIPLGKAPEGFRRPRGSSGYFDNQYNSSFIAGGPIEEPRLVVVVVIDDPGPERIRSRTHYGSSVAGPVVRRVMERGLTYLGVPPSPAPARMARGE